MATAAMDLYTTDRNAVSGKYSRKVIDYEDTVERLVKEAKTPNFAGWGDLEALVDVDNFERVGNDKAVMGWGVYLDLLNQWGSTTTYERKFRGISEVGQRVFMELTETNTPIGKPATVVNSLSVFAFNDAGKLVHLDIYLQHD